MNIVAAIQMCSSREVAENLATAGKLIEQAAQSGAKLVVLPEMFALMGTDQRDKVRIQEEPGQGPIQGFLASLAKKYRIWIVGGTVPLKAEKTSGADKIRAACLVYNEEGNCVARYDKIHLFDVTLSAHETYNESATTEPGEKCTVIDTPVGRLGLAVCFDLRFPEHFHDLYQMGAEIIVIPAAFTVKTGRDHWEILLRACAIQNFCYVLGACQGGTHPSGRKTWGHSMIVNPWGTKIAESDAPASDVITAEINIHAVHEARKMIPLCR